MPRITLLQNMNEYVYSPMKAAHTHTHRDIKVYKIDRGQNYTQKRKNYICYLMCGQTVRETSLSLTNKHTNTQLYFNTDKLLHLYSLKK